MKGKIESKKRIEKIGAIAVLGIFTALMLAPVPVAASYGDNDWEVTGENIWMGYTGAECTGNTGIGTDSPTAKLHVVGDVTIDSGDLNVDSGTLFVDESADRVGIGDTSPDFKLEVTGSSGSGYFGVTSSSDGDVFKIDSLGNVGIGVTATSLHRLTIQSTDDNTLRLIGPDGIYGSGVRINFGDQDWVYIDEDEDDKLYIYGRHRTAIMGGDVGIGTTNPGAKLDVEVSSGGAATIGHSSNSATGHWAIAMGYGTRAVGSKSITMGYLTTANGIASTAMGYETTASGDHSTAMGYKTTASEYASTAMGGHTTAGGMASTAMGGWMRANGDYSFGIGLGYKQFFWTITQDNTMAIMGGKVGIGTVSPDKLLHLGDNTEDINGEIRFEASNGEYVDLGITTNDEFYITGGNVGIGTTNPGGRLEVYTSENQNSGTHFLFSAASGTGTNNADVMKIYSGRDNGFTGALFRVDNSVSNKFYIKGNGNIGIGTSNPGAALDVGGGSSDLADGSNDVLIKGDLEVDTDVQIDGGNIITSANTNWDIADSSTTSLTIENNLFVFDTQNSRIGIGVVDPDATFEIVELGAAQLRLSSTETEGEESGFYTDFETDSTGDLYITPNGGDVHIGKSEYGSDLTVYNSATNQFKICYDGSSSTTFGTDSNGYLQILPTGNIVSIGGRLFTQDSDNSDDRRGMEVFQSGAPSYGDEIYGLYVKKSGDGEGTNIAGYFSATQATNNYGLIVANGNVGIGTTQPQRLLHLYSSGPTSDPLLRYDVQKVSGKSATLDYIPIDVEGDVYYLLLYEDSQ